MHKCGEYQQMQTYILMYKMNKCKNKDPLSKVYLCGDMHHKHESFSEVIGKSTVKCKDVIRISLHW